jgi:hypothetical protein
MEIESGDGRATIKRDLDARSVCARKGGRRPNHPTPTPPLTAWLNLDVSLRLLKVL